MIGNAHFVLGGSGAASRIIVKQGGGFWDFDGKEKLIRFPDANLNTWEFFDLEKDPMEMKNLYRDKSYTANIQAMKKELHRLRKQYEIED